MGKEELIQELKKIEGVKIALPYFAKQGFEESENRIEWHSELNILAMTTDYQHEWDNENTKTIDGLEPNTILDLFRKWKQ